MKKELYEDLVFTQLQIEVEELTWSIEKDKKQLAQLTNKLQEMCTDSNTHEYDFEESDRCMHCNIEYLGDPTDSLEQG